MRRSLMLSAVLALPLSAAAAEVADYRFENTLQSSILGAPPLEPLGIGGGFVDAVVAGRSVRAWHVDAQTGFELDVAGRLPADRYTLVLQIASDDLGGYEKLVDTRMREFDGGLYLSGDALVFYPYVDQFRSKLLPATYYTLAVTRAPGGQYIGYLDGIEEFRIDDVDGVSTIDAGLITLFRDDLETGDQESFVGTVARIRLFDEVLTSSQIAELGGSTLIFRDGFQPRGGPAGSLD